MILETEYVGSFDVNEINQDNEKYLEISGHSLHSALNVENIKTQRDENDLIIKIYLTLRRASKNSSGTFKYRVKIDDGIERVLFGKNKTVIWERK